MAAGLDLLLRVDDIVTLAGRLDLPVTALDAITNQPTPQNVRDFQDGRRASAARPASLSDVVGPINNTLRRGSRNALVAARAAAARPGSPTPPRRLRAPPGSSTPRRSSLSTS